MTSDGDRLALEILLHEYDSLRDESIAISWNSRTSNLTMLGGVTVVAVAGYQFATSPTFLVCFVVIAIILIRIRVRSAARAMQTVAHHLRDLEDRINAIAHRLDDSQAPLLTWESTVQLGREAERPRLWQRVIRLAIGQGV